MNVYFAHAIETRNTHSEREREIERELNGLQTEFGGHCTKKKIKIKINLGDANLF